MNDNKIIAYELVDPDFNPTYNFIGMENFFNKKIDNPNIQYFGWSDRVDGFTEDFSSNEAAYEKHVKDMATNSLTNSF